MKKKAKEKKELKAFVFSDGSVRSAEDFYEEERRQKSLLGRQRLVDAISTAKRPSSEDNSFTATEEREISGQDQLKLISTPIDVGILESAFMLNSVHYRCCVIKAEDVTSKGFVLEQKTQHITGQGDKIDEKVLNKEISSARNLIDTCFGGRGGKAVVDALVIDQQSIGWACAEIIRTITGDIVDIIPHPASQFRWNKDGYIIQMVGSKKRRFLPFGTKFKFISKGGKRSLDKASIVSIEPDATKDPKRVSLTKSATEILWFNRYTSMGGIYGIPDIIAALASLANVTSIDDYLTKFFENNAVPQYAVVVNGVDEIDQSIVQLIRSYFAKELKGNPHSTMVLSTPTGAELKFEKLSVDTQEASFQETKKTSREDIYIAHGVPPARLGIIETSNLGAGSGLSQAESYKNGIIIPLQKLVSEQFWGFIFGENGMGLQYIQLRYIDLEVRDYDTLKDQHKEYLDRGVLTINEVRKELDYGPVTGGDRAFIKTTSGIIFVDALEDAQFKTKQDVNNKLKQLEQDFHGLMG